MFNFSVLAVSKVLHEVILALWQAGIITLETNQADRLINLFFSLMILCTLKGIESDLFLIQALQEPRRSNGQLNSERIVIGITDLNSEWRSETQNHTDMHGKLSTPKQLATT